MNIVVDYGRGNLYSLGQALRHIDVDHVIVPDPTGFERATHIIVPGVGAFGDASRELAARGFVAPLRAAAARGVPILGICVGCQLLLSRGEEFGDHAGLDLIPGTVSRLPDPQPDDPEGVRVPNVGWRRLDIRASTAGLDAVGDGGFVYFVHSYAPFPDHPADILASVRINNRDVPAAVGRSNVTGFQFHPEKSGPTGLAILSRFFGHDGMVRATATDRQSA